MFKKSARRTRQDHAGYISWDEFERNEHRLRECTGDGR